MQYDFDSIQQHTQHNYNEVHTMFKKSFGFGLLAAGLMIAPGAALADVQSQNSRSEERRVGKECRSRWSPYH